MPLQYLSDVSGVHTAVLIPINEWENITRKHQDLKQLETQKNVISGKKLSDLAGSLSKETASAMLKYVEESRNGWDDRLKNQF